MANDVEIIVTAEDRTAAAFASAKANAKRGGEEAGSEFIRGIDGRLRDANGRFAKAGGDSGKSFVDGFGKDSGGGIGGMFARMGAQAVSAGADLGSKLAGGVVSSLESTGPGGAAVGAAIVGVGLAVAPVLAGILSGAVIGAAGTGGLIGGIMLVKDDPRVQAAATDVGRTVSQALRVEAEPLVEPVVDGLGTIRNAVLASSDDFGRLFQNAAGWIDPLADAAASFIDDFTDGLASVSDAGDAPMLAIAEGIDGLGASVEDVFELFSKVGPEGALALALAFDIVGESVEGVSRVVVGFTKIFGWLAEHGVFGDHMKEELERFREEAEGGKDSADGLADSVGKVGDGADRSADALREMADALTAATDPTFALFDAQSQVTKATQEYNEAVAKYGANSEQAREAAVNLAEANVRLQGAAANAAGTLTDEVIDSLLNTMRASGASESAIRAVESALRATRAEGEKFNGQVWTATFRTEYITYRREVYIPSTTTKTGSGELARRAGGAYAAGGAVGLLTQDGPIGAAATGGARGGLMLVGEAGPELVRLPYGSTVMPAGQTQRAATDATGGQWNGGRGQGGSSSDSGLAHEVRQLRRAVEDLQRRPVTAISREGRDAAVFVRTG